MTSVGRFLFSQLVLPAIAVQAKETDIEEHHRDAVNGFPQIANHHDRGNVHGSNLDHRVQDAAPAYSRRGVTGRGVSYNTAVANANTNANAIVNPVNVNANASGLDDQILRDFIAFRQWQAQQNGGNVIRTPSNGLRIRGGTPVNNVVGAQQVAPNIIIVNAGNNSNLHPSNLSSTHEPGGFDHNSATADDYNDIQKVAPSLPPTNYADNNTAGAPAPSGMSPITEAKETGDLHVDINESGMPIDNKTATTPHSCNTVEQVKSVTTVQDGEVVNKMVTHQVTYSNSELYVAATQFYHRLLAELLGTWALTFFIAGLVIESSLQHINQMGVAIGAGLVFVFLIYSLGQVSGAHFNPVVTYAFVLRGMFPLTWLPFYWIVQFVGAILASGMLLGFYGTTVGDAGATSVPPAYTQDAGFLMETVLTFVLVFTILSMASRSKIVGPHAALAIGAVIAFNVMFAGSYSGASMNPWRSLCFSIVFPVSFYSIWVYFAGPFLGSTLAVIMVFLLAGKPRNDELTAGIGATIAVAIGNSIARDNDEDAKQM